MDHNKTLDLTNPFLHIAYLILTMDIHTGDEPRRKLDTTEQRTCDVDQCSNIMPPAPRNAPPPTVHNWHRYPLELILQTLKLSVICN